MSGIVGMINLDAAPVDRDLLWRLTDFMSYRGPDAQQVWTDNNIGLGHTLLGTTTQAENERQIATVDGEVWLIADARIDARPELLRKLRATGELSDAALILYAYQSWGEECVKHLIGDFAFAIWDRRTQSLFCARDHLGVKPFFYAHTPKSFIFSNTLDALRLDRRISDELNEIAIGDYLLFGLNQDLSGTTFRDIHRLPAGHTLTVANGRVKTRCYWRPTATNELRFRNHQSYIEHFDQLLTAAVLDRLRIHRVGVSMSGGLDSTSVAARAHELLNTTDAVHGYAVVYDSLIPDEERHYSQAAADHIGIPVTHINADQFPLFDTAAADDLHQPEPFLMSPLMGQFNALLRLCAEHSRVALTGWDGDTLMNEPVNSYFSLTAGTLRLNDFLTALAWYVKTQRRVPGFGIRGLIDRVSGKQNASAFYPRWIDDSFARRTKLRERLLESSSIQNKHSKTRPMAFRSLASKVWAPLFEGYDAGATKLPLELRHPFIDLRLVEFLLAIPAIPWCVEKHILRVAMKDRLPASVLNRHKTPLGGDPALQMTRRASVRCLDSFEVSPQLRYFVNLNERPSIAEEQTPDGIWSSLRVFALNHWLSNSQPKDRLDSRKVTGTVQAITETSIA